MSNEVFDAKFLVEKLSKLNNSQQSIESLSRLCISHRKEANQIVETWEKMFKSSSKEQCVSFLYLANDILQNSKKTGSEFVNEFWKVLPAALKYVYDNGDEKTSTRLVNIWEERKVFGSRIQSLKDELVVKQGKVSQTQTVSKGKSTTKIVKREPQLLRVKLAVGGFPEKIVSAYHFVRDECSNEDSDVAKCSSAAFSVEKIVKDLESDINQGIKPGSGMADEMQEQENALQQCVKQLEPAEASRVALVALLKEAVLDQETKLKSLHGQLQIAYERISDVEKLKPKLAMLNHAVSAAGSGALTEAPNVGELPMLSVQTGSAVQALSSQPVTMPQIPVHQVPLPPGLPTTSFAAVVMPDEESKKAQAAAVAAKLAASTSSAQMLASVLSSLAAEQTASMNDPLLKGGLPPALPMFSPEKRQKVEHPSSGVDVTNTELDNSPYFIPLMQPISSMPVSQANQIPGSIGPPLPPPSLPPPMMPSNSSTNQFVQSSGMMLNMVPYGFGGNGLPPPPPIPSHLAMGLARPLNPHGSQPLQPPHQQNATGGYYQPPGMGLYGSNSQPSASPSPVFIQRQYAASLPFFFIFFCHER